MEPFANYTRVGERAQHFERAEAGGAEFEGHEIADVAEARKHDPTHKNYIPHHAQLHRIRSRHCRRGGQGMPSNHQHY